MIADHTDLDALRAAMGAGPVTYYGGFDPTAPSLHFGNLVLLLTMRRLQMAGHRPIGLVGGATGLVGDPSGRTSERSLNEREVVEGWVERIRSQVERYLSFEGSNAAVIVNNLEWTGEMSAIDWLRDVGKHFSVSRMLAKEAVAARLIRWIAARRANWRESDAASRSSLRDVAIETCGPGEDSSIGPLFRVSR